MASNNNNDYEIALLDNENDARLCAQLLAQEFTTSNPLIVFCKTTAQQFFDVFWPLITESLDGKLSFFVRHKPTKEIVATMIANDLYSFCERHPSSVSNSAISDVHAEMRDRFVQQDLPRKLEPNMAIFLTAGATSSQHAGKGIGTRLRTYICQHARNVRGFRYVFVQTSNPATRHIYTTKLNGKETTVLPLKTWLWKQTNDQDGSYPYQDYNGEPLVNILIELK